MKQFAALMLVITAATAGAYDLEDESVWYFVNVIAGTQHTMVFVDGHAWYEDQLQPYSNDGEYLTIGRWRWRYEVEAVEREWPDTRDTPIVKLWWALTDEQEPDPKVREIVNGAGLAGWLE